MFIPTAPDSSIFLGFFPHSFSLRRPRSCPHFLCSTCLPSFLFSHPPEPNTCVSGEFQERGPGCRRKQSVMSSLLLGTSHSLPACLRPLWRGRATPEIVFLEGGFCYTVFLFRKLGIFLSPLYCAYTHIQTQLGAHSCTRRDRNTLSS